MTPLASYPSLDAFYAANPVRGASPEWDYGVMWHEPDAIHRWPVHRVSWVVDTGEVVLVRLGGRPLAEGTVRVLARIEKHDVDRVLDGWAEQSGDLAWLYARLANVNTNTEVAA